MKKVILFIATTFSILTAYSQIRGAVECKSILVFDSLFSKRTDPYNFDIVTGDVVHNVLKSQIENINDVVIVENNCLKFRISYSCGCGDNEKKLVTNGEVFQDELGRNYYKIRLLFINRNKGCEALCHDKLSFDISSLKNNPEIEYLKFVGFTELIKIPK